MHAQAYGWPVAPAWGVGGVVSGTDPTDQPLTSSVTALWGTKKNKNHKELSITGLIKIFFLLVSKPGNEEIVIQYQQENAQANGAGGILSLV